MTYHSCHAPLYVTLGFPSIQAVYGQSLLPPDTSLVSLPFLPCLYYVAHVFIHACVCMHTHVRAHTHGAPPPLCLCLPHLFALLSPG